MKIIRKNEENRKRTCVIKYGEFRADTVLNKPTTIIKAKFEIVERTDLHMNKSSESSHTHTLYQYH